MTREEAIKHKEVIQSFIDGAKIEYYNVYFTEWIEAECPLFDEDTEYRVKPKEELVPMDFSDAERLIGKVVRNKESKELALVTRINKELVLVGLWINYIELFKEYEFLDGSPIGKLAE